MACFTEEDITEILKTAIVCPVHKKGVKKKGDLYCINEPRERAETQKVSQLKSYLKMPTYRRDILLTFRLPNWIWSNTLAT